MRITVTVILVKILKNISITQNGQKTVSSYPACIKSMATQGILKDQKL